METYVIHVTKKCNCDCLYCYEEDKTSVYTWKEIKELIDNIVENRTENAFAIEFLGGEPMLEWELIKNSYEYLESFSEINVEEYIITTNGTILTDDMIGFLSKTDKITIAVSLDGDKWSNQLRIDKFTRKNTYDLVISNLDKLLKNNIPMQIHMVVTPYNVAYLYHNIKHFYDLGYLVIDPGIIEKTIQIDKSFANRYIEEMKKVSDSIKDGTMKGLEIGLFNWLKPTSDIRTYIKDESGKVIGESYGRSGNDITSSNEYNIIKCTDKRETDMLIDYIRESVYNYHNGRNI